MRENTIRTTKHKPIHDYSVETLDKRRISLLTDRIVTFLTLGRGGKIFFVTYLSPKENGEYKFCKLYYLWHTMANDFSSPTHDNRTEMHYTVHTLGRVYSLFPREIRRATLLFFLLELNKYLCIILSLLNLPVPYRCREAWRR